MHSARGRCIVHGAGGTLLERTKGGRVAYEMVRQLAQEGDRIELAALIDTPIHPRFLPLGMRLAFRQRPSKFSYRANCRQRGLSGLRYIGREISRIARGLCLWLGRPPEDDDVGNILNLPPVLLRVRAASAVALTLYRPPRYSEHVLYLRATQRTLRESDLLLMWQQSAPRLEVAEIPGTHLKLIEEPAVDNVAATLAERLSSQLADLEDIRPMPGCAGLAMSVMMGDRPCGNSGEYPVAAGVTETRMIQRRHRVKQLYCSLPFRLVEDATSHEQATAEPSWLVSLHSQ